MKQGRNGADEPPKETERSWDEVDELFIRMDDEEITWESPDTPEGWWELYREIGWDE